MMMTNLFSIFDPASSFTSLPNWLSIFTWAILIPLSMVFIPNRIILVFSFMTNYIFNEFKPFIKSSMFVLSLIIPLFLFIMFNNVMSLASYVFNSTSHMSITLSLALPMWLALMFYGWSFNTSNLLTHLIPQGTPFALAPFMVLIETISHLIRPLTLAIRLAANMIAGHLLITLLTSASPLTPLYLSPILGTAQMMLGSLETAVAFIQAYVFSVLMSLYISDATS